MSFSSDAKEEMCRAAISSRQQSLAEGYGILLFCNTFAYDGIRIVTESPALVKRIPKLFKKAFGTSFDEVPLKPENNAKNVLSITKPEKLEKIFDCLGYERGKLIAQHVNFGLLEEEECRQSFLRGAFLAGGSITDPRKRYHLELVTAHYNVSRELYTIMLEMGFNPKSAPRNGSYIIYFKSSSEIEDFLTTVAAPVSAMDIMSAKIEKDMKNTVNRKVNCDTANATKIVEAAQEQVEAIQKLKSRGDFKTLSEKLRTTAEIRLMYPELSLSELAPMLKPPVTKSCLNHRLKKIVLIANEG